MRLSHGGLGDTQLAGVFNLSILLLRNALAEPPVRAKPFRKGENKMGIARSFNSWIKYRQIANELEGLSNRQLADLGIERRNIDRVAVKAAL